METTAPSPADVLAPHPVLVSRVDNRLAKLSRFAGADAKLTPGRLRRPFTQRTWLALPADVRLEHLRVTITKQIEEEYAARLAAKAPAPKATPAPAPLAPAPAPRPVAVPRFVALCRSCGEEVAVHTAAPRVTYCAEHKPRRTPKRVVNDER